MHLTKLLTFSFTALTGFLAGAWTPSTNIPKGENGVSRRSVIIGGSAVIGSILAPNHAVADEIPITPFNGLIFNYRGSDYGGLDASTLNEPSIPYKDFIEKMKAGQVEFVEFIAPNGDAAYATFKSDGDSSLTRIRIGEGYPVEQADGWSSPAFAVRAVKNAGVPYKFTVPGLAKYSS